MSICAALRLSPMAPRKVRMSRTMCMVNPRRGTLGKLLPGWNTPCPVGARRHYISTCSDRASGTCTDRKKLARHGVSHGIVRHSTAAAERLPGAKLWKKCVSIEGVRNIMPKHLQSSDSSVS